MTTLLYIEASPKREESRSSSVAAAFLSSFKKQNPNTAIDHLHLFEDTLPAFGREGATQKFANVMSLIMKGESLPAIGEWAGVMEMIQRLNSADKVVISSPIWNFGMPYPLKHYLDIICQPGVTFTMNEQGEYIGLVTGKPLQLIISSGSEYPERFPQKSDGTKTDFMVAHLKHVFGMMGFNDIRTLRVSPTDANGPEAGAQIVAARKSEAERMATAF